MNSIKEKVQQLAKDHGYSTASLERKLGFSNGSIAKWDKQSPSADRLQQVADHFNVSVDYLLGRNQAPEWAKKEDVIDLEDFLNDNVHMAYGGENLTNEEKEQLKVALTTIFWKHQSNYKK